MMRTTPQGMAQAQPRNPHLKLYEGLIPRNYVGFQARLDWTRDQIDFSSRLR